MAHFESLLPIIKNNILGWGLVSEVPGFEKHIQNYWPEALEFEECNAEKQWLIRTTTTTPTVYIYVCKNNAWQKANVADINCPAVDDCLFDSRDNETYRIVTVEGMTFMLDWQKYRGEDGNFGGDFKIGNNSPYIYTGYTWDEAQIACPAGWRLPNSAEAECIVSSPPNKCNDKPQIPANIYDAVFWSDDGNRWGSGGLFLGNYERYMVYCARD